MKFEVWLNLSNYLSIFFFDKQLFIMLINFKNK